MATRTGHAVLLLSLVFVNLIRRDAVVAQFEPSPSPSPLPDPGSPPAPPALTPSPEPEAGDPEGFPPQEPPSGAPSDDDGEPQTITWCALPEEAAICTNLVSLLSPEDRSKWSCVRRDSKIACLDAIRSGEADLVSLDAGLAYIALMNYSMKSLMAEEYCYHQQSYDALMVVNSQMCDKKPTLSIKDFRGLKSCHASYQSAASWNYAVNFLLSARMGNIPANFPLNDQKVITNFFSQSCAPSDNGRGICSACNSSGAAGVTCDSSSEYAGYKGAFRCLVEGKGDIAFLRSGTAQLFAKDGFLAQQWSVKPLSDFMYLCPTGGCRPINDDRSTCTLGSVAANTIMVPNSISVAKKISIVHTLSFNARNWIVALFSGNNSNDILLSASAEGIAVVDQLTKEYLGLSANVSSSIQQLNANILQASDLDYISSGASGIERATLTMLAFLALITCGFWW